MRLTASSAIGEIGAAFLPRLALAATSASYPTYLSQLDPIFEGMRKAGIPE